MMMFPTPAAPEPTPSRLECWLKWLFTLFPLAALVAPSAAGDPVRGIGLPDGTLLEDTSTISAYYLSFYE